MGNTSQNLARQITTSIKDWMAQSRFNSAVPPALVAVGAPMVWPDDKDAPFGWVDGGDEVSRSDYADLYGETSAFPNAGPGDGETTFDVWHPTDAAGTDMKWVIKT